MVAVSPGAGVLVSVAMNVLVFALMASVASLRGLLPPVAPWSVVLFVAGGLAGTLVGRNLSYLSISRIGASRTVTVRLSNSVFSLLIAYAVLRELPRGLQLVGMAAVTVGLWWCLRAEDGPDPRERRAIDLGGVLIALGSGAAFAAGDTARRAGLHLTPAPVLGAAIGATSALLAHLGWSTFNRDAGWPPPRGLWRLDVLGSAAFNTAAILLLYVALQRAPVAIVSALYNLQVLVVLLIGPFLLYGQERLTARLALGALIALAGATLIVLG